MSLTLKSSINLTPDLFDAARAKAKAEGYDSFSGYITGLIRLDMMANNDHALAQRIAGMPYTKRDKIDAKMLETAELALTQWKLTEGPEDATVAKVMAAMSARIPEARVLPLDRSEGRTRRKRTPITAG